MKKRAANDDAGFPRDDHQAVACFDESACKHVTSGSGPRKDLRSSAPSLRVAGIAGYDRLLRGLQADSRAGCARDERGSAVDYA
jgi:hypothetical protein